MDEVELPDEQAQLWYLIRRVAGLLDRTGDALFRRELDISLAQFLVLSVVDAHPGPLNQQAIADRLGLTKGTVSRQIEQAVTAGLMDVQPSSQNRRENALSLTAAGMDVVRRGDALYADARRTTLPAADAADIGTTLRVLGELNRALG
jgi:DNA-binding MarR family transcriptional regulator